MTAVEDKLQDNVEQTIDAFKKAGIKIWILTGDNLECALNIAMSCNLINSQMNRIILEESDYNQLMD